MEHGRTIRTLLKPLFLLGVLACGSILSAQSVSPLSMVDPFIGTGPDGHTFPGATVPFGMVQLSPDTQIRSFKQSYKWAAGYRYEDTTILGFSHTHFSGAGHSDLGDVLLQPISGNVRLEPGDIDKPSPATARVSATTVRRRRRGTTRSRCSTTTSVRNSPRRSASAFIATLTPRISRLMCCSICGRRSITIRARCCGRASACVPMVR